ncbi:SitI3 family protein [Archangium lansingense]|uniref:SitI3 family protein n=1 Tax=Archangium lansingense TaxID=2995310 RepID=UPI003B7A17D3
MAIDYFLELATHLTSSKALGLLSRQTPGLMWSEDKFFLFNPSTSISATESRALTQSIIADAFHFTPTLAVSFRYSKEPEHYDDFRQIMLEATLLLLEHAQDAVLLFNGEEIVLQRLGGKFAVNSDYHIWDDWLESRLTIPFEHRPLPSPLL